MFQHKFKDEFIRNENDLEEVHDADYETNSKSTAATKMRNVFARWCSEEGKVDFQDNLLKFNCYLSLSFLRTLSLLKVPYNQC